MTKPGGNWWTGGLLKSINDTTNHIISTNTACVINDKFPKAQHHYLVLPKEPIATIFDLKLQHLPLLEELHLLAINIIEVKQQRLDRFKIGFHAQPSMEQVHLHVISKDFVSDCLKTKKHWNSFNTQLFVPYEVLYQELKENGHVRRLSAEEIKNLSAADLRCNQCDYIGKNIPKLKEHLLMHWTKYKDRVI